MAQFVVLTHDFPVLHWDLMLEKEAALRTWKLFRPPDEPGPIDAQALPDHRRHYLDYEGPVSGNRGEVRRWDAGEYTLVAETADRIEIALAGTNLRGTALLKRSDAPDGWTFRFEHLAGEERTCPSKAH